MDSEDKSCHHCEKRLFKANELPIYESLEDTFDYEVAQKDPSPLLQGISYVRKNFTGYIGSMQSAKDIAGDVYEAARHYGKTGYEYITDDDKTLPKAAVITVGGLTGLLIGAARGGLFKKVFYSGTGMVVVASILYPKQAFEYSQSGYQWTKAKTVSIVKKTTGQDLNTSWNITEKLPYKPPFDKISEQVKEMFNAKKEEGDIGQSNPVDKDLYTTRSK